MNYYVFVTPWVALACSRPCWLARLFWRFFFGFRWVKDPKAFYHAVIINLPQSIPPYTILSEEVE